MEDTSIKTGIRGCECGGREYVLTEHGKQACICLKLKKLRSRLKEIGEVKIDKSMIRVLDAHDSKDGLDPRNNLYLCTAVKDQAKINGVIAYLWSKVSFMNTIKIMNVYELIEIYLGKFEDTPSIFNLNTDILVMTEGHNEFENKRLPDIILQTLEYRRSKSLSSWIICIGQKCSLPSVHEYLLENKFVFRALTPMKQKSLLE